MATIVVAGGGALGGEIAAAIRDLQDDLFAGYLDDADLGEGRLGPIDARAVPTGADVIMGMGEPAVRWRIARRLGDACSWATVVHRTAVVAPTALIGRGCFLGPFTYVGPNASLGAHVVLNTHASVGHDAEVGAFAIFSPYAVINGNVKLGDGSFLGTHAVATPGIQIGEWSKMAAGAVLTQDCEAGTLVAGPGVRTRVMFNRPEERT